MNEVSLLQSLGQVSASETGQVFRDFLRGHIREMICEVMAAEVTELCGPKHAPSGAIFPELGLRSVQLHALSIRLKRISRSVAFTSETVASTVSEGATEPRSMIASGMELLGFCIMYEFTTLGD